MGGSHEGTAHARKHVDVLFFDLGRCQDTCNLILNPLAEHLQRGCRHKAGSECKIKMCKALATDVACGCIMDHAYNRMDYCKMYRDTSPERQRSSDGVRAAAQTYQGVQFLYKPDGVSRGPCQCF